MNIPTKITVSRIVAIIGMLIALFILELLGQSGLFVDFYLGNSGVSLVRLILCFFFIVAAFTDLVDGYLARKWHQVTDLGKFLDPIADKLLVDCMLIFLVIQSSYGKDDMLIPVFAVILMIARDLVIDGLRSLAASKNVVLAANMFGKIKTVCQMVAIPVVMLNGWPFSYFDASWGQGRIGLILIYIATAASLLSGLFYLVDNRAIFKENKK